MNVNLSEDGLFANLSEDGLTANFIGYTGVSKEYIDAYNLIQDTSIDVINAYQLIQDASIYAFGSNDVTFDYVDGSIVAAVSAVDTSLVAYTDVLISYTDGSLALKADLAYVDASFYSRAYIDGSLANAGDVTKDYVDGSIANFIKDSSFDSDNFYWNVDVFDVSTLSLDDYLDGSLNAKEQSLTVRDTSILFKAFNDTSIYYLDVDETGALTAKIVN